VAPDGLIGHEMAVKNQFDVLILDIMLPGLNGIQLCKQLRRQYHYHLVKKKARITISFIFVQDARLPKFYRSNFAHAAKAG
jgi:CheY-like chemotaxis protein